MEPPPSEHAQRGGGVDPRRFVAGGRDGRARPRAGVRGPGLHGRRGDARARGGRRSAGRPRARPGDAGHVRHRDLWPLAVARRHGRAPDPHPDRGRAGGGPRRGAQRGRRRLRGQALPGGRAVGARRRALSARSGSASGPSGPSGSRRWSAICCARSSSRAATASWPRTRAGRSGSATARPSGSTGCTSATRATRSSRSGPAGCSRWTAGRCAPTRTRSTARSEARRSRTRAGS